MIKHLRSHAWTIALIFLGGVLPIVLYWGICGRAPTISPQETRARLADPATRSVLVDVRSFEEFATSHLEGAVNWSLTDIEQFASGQAVPPGLENRQLLLICDGGFRSARAALALQSRTGLDAVSIRGGLQEWTGRAAPNCPVGMAFVAMHTPANPSTTSPLPSRITPWYAQWAALLSAFGVKPLYMLLSVLLILWLWRQRSADLVALRWGLAAFLAGESFCALNYLLYQEDSYLLEYLHSLGMVLAFGFTAWAFMEGFDTRVLRFSQVGSPCAFGPLCQRCIKHATVYCRLRRLFLWMLIPMTLCLAALPLCMGFRHQAYTTHILGSAYGYLHPVVHQLFEFRYLPIIALVCTLMSLMVMLVRERHPLPVSKTWYAGALGALGFAYFRLLLLGAFADDQVWFVFWEEITELFYILASAGVLVIFRNRLFSAGIPRQMELVRP